MFRVVVQESRLTPTSGKVIAQLGSYDPHSKAVRLEKEKASFYLQNGAQPSDRAARLLQKEGVDMPKWVKLSADKKRSIKSPDKLRRNQPAAVPEPTAVAEAPAAEAGPEAETGTTEA